MKIIFFILFLFIGFLFAQNADFKQRALDYWHTKLSQYIKIDSENVKLAPDFITLGNDSYSLWNIFNATTDYNSTFYYNPSQYNNFSSTYGAILHDYTISASIEPTCNLNTAVLNFVNADGAYAWDKTINNLHSELASGKSMDIESETDIYDDDNITAHTIKVNAKYQNLLVFYSNPYARYNNQLSNYYPWYSPCILKNAFENRSDAYWESTFGANGYLKNITVALIVAKNGKTCITMLNKNPESNNSIDYSSCTQSVFPFIMGIVISPIGDFAQ